MTGSKVSAAPGDVTSVVSGLLARAVTSHSRDSARVRLADTVFAALVGARTRQGRASAALAESVYGASGSVAELLFRTVAAVRMTEIDDVDLPSCTTPGAVVIPIVLVLAAHGLTPAAAGGEDDGGLEQVLDIIAHGYDLVTGLGEAIDGPSRLAEGIWPTLAVAPVAAATIAGLALGFDDTQLAQAGTLAGFFRQDGNPRGNARETMLAASVVAGVQAALSVRHEIAVAARGSEVPFAGLLRTAGERDESGNGSSRVERAAIKHFCSARQVMTAVAAIRELSELGELGEVGHAAGAAVRIIVEVPPAYARMIDKPVVTSRRESLASAQYQLAAAIADPARLLDVDRDDLRLDDGFRSLMGRISVREAEDLRASYPQRWPARVRISGRGPDRVTQVDAVPGEADCSVPALERKFAALLAASNAGNGSHGSNGSNANDALDARLAGEAVSRSTAGTSLSDVRALACLLISEHAEGGQVADVSVKRG
jgi:2-methylcitrate dehydratase PrpD